MLYRKFPKIQDKEISVLGFGSMRFPLSTVDTEYGPAKADSNIDYETTKALIKAAYEQGVNYYDTAYFYHRGNSEVVLGKILRELGIREKVYIADKMPMPYLKEEADLEKYFNEQLDRLGTDYIDFYLLHALNGERLELVKKLNIMAFLEEKKRLGKIKHIGFSFHHEYQNFVDIIDYYPKWEFCQIQYNYLDENYQAGTKGLEYAVSKGIGVIVMEPLRGGLLARVPKPVIDIFSTAQKPRTAYEWALRWVWDKQGIVTALSGMGAMDEVLGNCAVATTGKINSLPSSQMKIIETARDWFKNAMKVPCTGCMYCTPCPVGVAIPQIFKEYNRLSIEGALETGRDSAGLIHSIAYSDLRLQGQTADKCINCGACMNHCPQNIVIPVQLAKIHKEFA